MKRNKHKSTFPPPAPRSPLLHSNIHTTQRETSDPKPGYNRYIPWWLTIKQGNKVEIGEKRINVVDVNATERNKEKGMNNCIYKKKHHYMLSHDFIDKFRYHIIAYHRIQSNTIQHNTIHTHTKVFHSFKPKKHSLPPAPLLRRKNPKKTPRAKNMPTNLPTSTQFTKVTQSNSE